MLQAKCEHCHAKGPSVDVSGMEKHAAYEKAKEVLFPWLAEHNRKIDMKRSYRTTDGVQLFYHRAIFGPVKK